MDENQQEVRAILDLGLPILLVILTFLAIDKLLQYLSSLF